MYSEAGSNRARLLVLIKQNTPESDLQAGHILYDELIPLLQEETDLLSKVTDAQHDLTAQRYREGTAPIYQRAHSHVSCSFSAPSLQAFSS